MNLVVQKFGGTSMGGIPRIQNVAKRVLQSAEQGLQPVVVVSAMAGETDRLAQLARQIHPNPFSREYDLILASGEQVSIGLLSLAINTLAGKERAQGLLGFQLGIKTNQMYSKARIREIRTDVLQKKISQNIIPIVAGFQGVDDENNITTLGRGGSDTSAIAIAAALQAPCEIYTDVEGVYTTDPRICPKAKKLNQISYEEMMELASLGSKVLQIRSVELAAKYKVPVQVRSSFNDKEGTHVVSKEQLNQEMESVPVTGIASTSSQVKFTLQNIPDEPGIAATIFGALSEKSIDVDIIVQDISTIDQKVTISFSVNEIDFLTAQEALEELKKTSLPSIQIIYEKDLAKISIVGVGMRNHPGVAAKMFTLLAQEKINIKLITTSEIKISCLIEEKLLNPAVNCLHSGFSLDVLE